MNRIPKIKSKFYIALSIAVLILFHSFFENLISGTVVKYFLSYCERSLINDIVLLALFLILLRGFLFEKYKYAITPNTILFLFIGIVLYCYYRYISGIWIFEPFYVCPRIKYLDLIALLGLAIIIVGITKILSPVQSLQSSQEIFIEDRSLGMEKQDELGYKDYAGEIMKRIKNTNPIKSFAIGVTGEWGIGKTSFFDLMKRHVKEEDDNIIVVNFTPWNSHSPEAIIKDFLDTLQSEFRTIQSTLAKQIIAYSEKLVPISKSSTIGYIQFFKVALGLANSTEELYEKINDLIGVLNIKVVVFLDDVDRLNKDEVFEVLKLIRNTANFRNTFFLVAYDKNYILPLIKENNPYSHEFFLEKIFQLEIHLPTINSNVYPQKLSEKLCQIIPVEYHKEIEESIMGPSLGSKFSLNDWIKNMRDVTRLVNSISLNYSNLYGEVLFEEFLKLELLRIKHHDVYELIFKSTNRVLKSTLNSEGKLFYDINNDSKTLLYGHKQDYDKDKIEILLGSIFVKDSYNYLRYKKKPHLSILYASNFRKYAAYSLLNDHLSEVEFNEYVKKGSKGFRDQISLWIERGLAPAFKRRIESHTTFNDIDEFQVLFDGIIYFLNQRVNKHYELRYSNIFGYLFEKKFYELIVHSKVFVSNKDVLIEYLKKLFIDAKSPYIFESAFLYNYLTDFKRNEINKELNLFNRLFCQSTLLFYLEDYCASVDSFDETVWHLFVACKVNFNPNDLFKKNAPMISYLDKAIIQMKNFTINKDLKGFLTGCISEKQFSSASIRYGINEYPQIVFGSLKNLISYLRSLDNKKDYVDEFISFSEFHDESKEYIDYNFKTIGKT